MLAALGVSYALLGHAERRLLAKEDDALIARKTAAGQKASLTNIVCFGEPMLIQQMEETLQYLKHQIIHSLPESFDPKRIILAYEPVWAIGTGKTPSVKHLTQLFKALRAFLSETFPNDAYSMRIVYGGSVNTKLAHMLAEIKDLDGLLIGRLSLNPDEMIKIASEFCRI